MHAVKEVGIKKIIRFIFASFFLEFFKHAVFPPVRAMLLRASGARVGRESVIHDIRLFNAYHRGFGALHIGNYCFVGDDVTFDLADSIELNDHVTLSNGVKITTHTNVGYASHPLQKHFPRFSRKVTLERGCFIGTAAIILPGVTIGEGAVVGAGAVVTRNVPSWTVVAGVPAKTLRKLKKK